MFNFFKRRTKVESESTERPRRRTSDIPVKLSSVDAHTPSNDNRTPKDVVNLLIPQTDYHQKTGVGAILEIMAGKRRRKGKRTQSYRISPPKTNVRRSESARDAAPTSPKNNDTLADDSAEFVKALVLQKYAKPDKHVSLVYVNEPNIDDKQHAEALLREIAKSIDETVDKINEDKQMGGTDSKIERTEANGDDVDNTISLYKDELKGELEKLLKVDEVESSAESPSTIKKSNLKLPKSDTEGCSDDDRSDCGKKKVTFRKHIVFDDGEQQTDEEVDSSFESLTSGEEEEYLEDVTENDNKTIINVNDSEPVKVNDDEFKRISSDNSDSGFLDDRNGCDDVTSDVKSLVESESESENESEEEILEEIEEIEEEIEVSESEEESDNDNE